MRMSRLCSSAIALGLKTQAGCSGTRKKLQLWTAESRYIFRALLHWPWGLALVTSVAIYELLNHGISFAEYLFLRTDYASDDLRLPIYHDPFGIVILMTFLITPVLFGYQVEYIKGYLSQPHWAYKQQALGSHRLDILALIAGANKAFRRLGSIWATLGLLLASGGVTYLAYYIGVLGTKIFEPWIPSYLSTSERAHVSSSLADNWWGAPKNTGSMIIFTAICVYGFYCLFMQWAVGVLFLRYASQIDRLGYAPSVSRLNVDGYHGVHNIRGFLLVTYLSTLLHWLALLSLTLGWLPRRSVSVAVTALALVLTVFVIFLPTTLLRSSVAKSKRNLLGSIAAQIDQVAIRADHSTARLQRTEAELANINTFGPGSEYQSALRAEIETIRRIPDFTYRLREAFGVFVLTIAIPVLLSALQALL
jgi:hypothetical protein